VAKKTDNRKAKKVEVPDRFGVAIYCTELGRCTMLYSRDARKGLRCDKDYLNKIEQTLRALSYPFIGSKRCASVALGLFSYDAFKRIELGGGNGIYLGHEWIRRENNYRRNLRKCVLIIKEMRLRKQISVRRAKAAQKFLLKISQNIRPRHNICHDYDDD